MTRVALLGGAYQARSVITAAARAVNLYPEVNPPESQSPVPVTHYPRPGLVILSNAEVAASEIATVRCLYTATNGDLYAVVGGSVYYVDPSYIFHLIGSVTPRFTPCSMADNGLVIVIVDGSANGWVIRMSDRAFAPVSDPSFYGGTRVDQLDTYFVFNRPGTNQFYISLSNADYTMFTGGTAFDPLDIAAKTGSTDPIQTCISISGSVWLIGTMTSEPWVDIGAPDFPFQRLPNALVEHGCAAAYSVAKMDASVFWLSKDRQGQGIIVMTEGYAVKRISTHAIEADIQSYNRIDDAVAWTYQIVGHAFYVISFPSANVSWAFELASQQWHRLAWCDTNGELHRYRGNCYANAYNRNVVGDWQNGNLYEVSQKAFTDAGAPIVCIRTFPHLVEDGNRVTYQSFIADMQVGTWDQQTLESTVGPDFSIIGYIGNPDFNLDFGPIPEVYPPPRPVCFLRWSDDRGVTFSNRVEQSIGNTGQYLTSVQWNRLGMARDRVFELSWSAPVLTALQGAFIDTMPHRT